MSKKAVSIISLGCFRNTYDSEIIIKRFLDEGYVLTPGLGNPSGSRGGFKNCDLLIVNTCGFIDRAKKESLEVIEEAVRLKKRNKVKRLLVLGCLVERYRRELEKSFPGVDEWRGIEEFTGHFARRVMLSPSHTAFLKICEGCFNKCSYCAIPLIKGPLRSKDEEEVIKEVRHLDAGGIRELNIIGQDITAWGRDLKGKPVLTTLLKRILKEMRNIKWVRLIYTHPRHVTDSLIDLIAHEDRICKYIDLPVQHINDRILRLMNRGLTRKETERLIAKIRKKIPGCFIRSSVIVGFPSETETEFKELLFFLKETAFERLGAFTYSREENTPAYDLSGQVHYRTMMRRLDEVMAQQRTIAGNVNERLLNKELDVLIEEKKSGVFIGRTEYDAYDVDGVVFLRKKNLRVGEFCRAKITGVHDYDLIAQ